MNRESIRLGRRWLAEAIELLLPHRCAACDEPLGTEDGFCDRCWEAVITTGPACPRCGLPIGGDHRHRGLAFDSASAPFVYGGAVAQALLRLKLSKAEHAAEPLGRLLGAAARRLWTTDHRVIPVPLHPRRLRQRGFNQAALIARALSCELRGSADVGRSSPKIDAGALIRKRDTPAQGKLGRAERLANLDGAFHAPRRLDGVAVLLIDDVMTTGATASACADTLRRAGSTRIDVLTVARAVP